MLCIDLKRYHEMARHNELGRSGEEIAVAFLMRKGYVILERNWYLKHLELDIICRKGELLVVVEVKTRRGEEEHPEELLCFRKRRNIRRAADAYIRLKNLDTEVRFDMLLISGADMRIRHIEDIMHVFD